VYLINSVGIGDDSFSITLGQKPSSFQTFDFLNDKYKDFCFIDEAEQSLKILLSERRNLFRTYYDVPISAGYSDIAVDDRNERVKTFYCYSKGGRTIEIVRMNFDEHRYSKQIIYTKGLVEDFKLLSDRLIDRQSIFILVRKGSQLYLQSNELKNFQLASSDLSFITSDYEKAWITFNIYKEIYFVKNINDQLELMRTTFDKKILWTQTVLNLKTIKEDEIKYGLIGIDELINRTKPVAFLLSINKKNELDILNNNSIKKYQLKSRFTPESILKYNLGLSKEEISFYIKDNIFGKLKRISFSEVNKAPVEKDIIESKNIYDYFITNINRNNTFLIYLNSIQNTLTFEKI